MADVIFAMPKPKQGEVEYAQAKQMNGDIAVVRLAKVSEEFDSQFNTQIGTQLTQMNAQQDLSGLISILRKTTDIEYFVVTQ
jgi:peptidyl-prolyl cis-trans isomerase D